MSAFPLGVAVTLEVRVGDVMEVPADVVAFKHAATFYGADSAAAKRLGDVGFPLVALSAPEGEFRVVDTRGALAAERALFLGVGSLYRLDYADVRSFSRRVVEVAGRELRARHVVMTIHGPGFGLDLREAFLSQVAGFVEAIEQLDRGSLPDRITVVNLDLDSVRSLWAILEAHLAEIPGAWVAERGEVRWVFGLGAPSQTGGGERETAVEPIELLARRPDREPHVFIAYPFEREDDARYGVERPAIAAGFLARLIGDDFYTGDILARIKNQIESAAFVVAVLTQANPNVYLEVGYAWGKNRPTVLVAHKDEPLRFDVQGHRVVRYGTISELEKKFTQELEGLRASGEIEAPAASR